MSDQKPPKDQTPGNTGDESGGGNLDDVKLQDIYQRQSLPLQILSNIAKKFSDISGSIITGKLGGAGQAGEAKKKSSLGLLAVLLFAGVAIFVVVRLFPPWMMQPENTVPNPGPPEINEPNSGLPQQPLQYPPNPCVLEFENPTGPKGIPLHGPLEVQWSEVPEAASYELRIVPPADTGAPWIMPMDGTSKTIFMENFPAAGEHKFALSALDDNGAALCSIELAFDKPATGEEDRKTRDSESAGGESAEPVPCNSLLPC